MVLGFNPQFVPPVRDSRKRHTIREDSGDRWQPGMKIHMATGVRTKNYNCFSNQHSCIAVQRIQILHTPTTIVITIDGRYITGAEREALALNDGFDSLTDFYAWFKKDFTGKIIHWTDLKY